MIQILFYFTFVLITKSQNICGESKEKCSWEYNETTTTLTFTGIGQMKTYNRDKIPWKEYNEVTTQIVFNGITYISKYAFYNFNVLVRKKKKHQKKEEDDKADY